MTDVMISGTRTLSATELARITGELTGNCFNDDSEEIGERVTSWIAANPSVHIFKTVVSLTSDLKFHCFSIVLFCAAV